MHSERSKPRFSIVIPSYQRPEGLRNCLTGILALKTPAPACEVIIVDDAGEADLTPVLESFQSDLNLILIRHAENRGPASARNTGAQQARGDYLLFIDDDCIPSRDWLERIEAHVNGSNQRAIGGYCRNGLTDSLCSTAQQMLMDYLFKYYNSNPAQAGFCATNNLAVPRKAFLAIGGFDESFRYAAGEDRDFSERWSRSGAELAFVQDAPVYHQHTMGLKGFVRMHYHYGRGARRFRSTRTESGVHGRFEPLGFYFGLVAFPFTQVSPLRACVISALQVLSQAVHTLGYLTEFAVAGKPSREAPRQPLQGLADEVNHSSSIRRFQSR